MKKLTLLMIVISMIISSCHSSLSDINESLKEISKNQKHCYCEASKDDTCVLKRIGAKFRYVNDSLQMSFDNKYWINYPTK